ncbi:hypothetical protein LSH36_74g13013 [Paralvinella palmiformis]|uniref:26S proteasome non-ATPase regulatory subunit 4 n=1 Tax=Paralvinella palmiformis TaxID=53620 RepID=A0AAD9K3Q7_9ANNE|nr:hypothetical protein LSH36_74g13013 [Paralvinella palmiformis]
MIPFSQTGPREFRSSTHPAVVNNPCVDNSDYMRNGDFVPTRLQAQQDAVNLICHSKTRQNPENNVGLLTLASTEVLVTLTSDVGKILAKLHQVQPRGNIKLIPAIRIAHLALKHRQNKNQKMRIVVFVGSPIQEDDKELQKLAKRLKKEKVNVDIISFGEDAENNDKLTNFVKTINGKEEGGSHLVTVSTGPMLSDALVSSPVIVGEDGAGAVPGGMSGFEFGIDPNEDPELALALRVSMEEQRARQEEEARKVAAESAAEAPPTTGGDNNEEVLLKQALEMSMQVDTPAASVVEKETKSTPSTAPDFNTMSEEEQIAYAMQMSLASSSADSGPTPMETNDGEASSDKKDKKEEDEDYSEMISDPEFLQSVLEGLPGVDPQSEAIRSAIGQLTDKNGSQSKKGNSGRDDKKGDKKDEKK